jgi:membrane protein DedA with SNARE-associated domain
MDSILVLIQSFSENPLVQAILAGFSTFILEDPTTIGCGLLVAAGKMHFFAAYAGVTLGITLGDLGLYAIGRYLAPRVVSWNLVTRTRLDQAEDLFRKNMILAVVGSRFLPGMRLPTYIAAGIAQAPVLRFLVIALPASILWTFLLISMTIAFGEAILPVLGRYKLPFAIGLIGIIAWVRWLRIRKNRRDGDKKAPVVSIFEFWPAAVFYFPIAVQYLYLSIRYWGITLPTVANPGMERGAFIGESKSKILDTVPNSVKQWFPLHIGFQKPNDLISEEGAAEMALEAMDAAGIELPIVAKPDIGQKGFGVRPIRDKAQLIAYMRGFPAGETIVLQKLVPYQKEAGVFYIRKPNEPMGRIFSINFKMFPTLVGDGERSLKELILSDPRSRRLRHIFFPRHGRHLDRIISEGEKYQLVFVGDHAQGCIFKEGTDRQTPALLARIHEISIALPEFYFGRMDIRYRSDESFLRGEDFQIVEVNGAGSEATNIWDPEMHLLTAYAILFRQWSLLFEISAMNRKRGYKPSSLVQLTKDAIRFRRLKPSYPSAQ